VITKTVNWVKELFIRLHLITKITRLSFSSSSCFCDISKKKFFFNLDKSIYFLIVSLIASLFLFFRCHEKQYLQPPQNPMNCKNSKKLEASIAIKCCSYKDFCNREINLTLPSVSPAGNYYIKILLPIVLIIHNE